MGAHEVGVAVRQLGLVLAQFVPSLCIAAHFSAVKSEAAGLLLIDRAQLGETLNKPLSCSTSAKRLSRG